jgi:uncharacterized protein (TIGR00661 family)
MRVVWCSISAHGLGHAAQLMPILNELGTVIDDLWVILRTQVPADFFQRHLQVKWDLHIAQQDVGCIQRGPLDLDVAATWHAYARFHANWEDKVVEEARAIRTANADLVISNISHLAIAAAARAHCPVVGIASLSWDRVLEPYRQDHIPSQLSILETIRSGYALTNQLIRLHPGIEMPAFPSIVDVGPSVPVTKPNVDSLRKLLGIPENELIVLIAFGGVPLNRLPLKELESLAGFQFLVGELPRSPSYARVHRLEGLPLSFLEILKQADIIMSKPGYGTVMAAVHYGKALVYVRRRDFIDEQVLVAYLHRYGRGVELSREDFDSGDWLATLWAVHTVPDPSESPPPPGVNAVVHLLKSYLQS